MPNDRNIRLGTKLASMLLLHWGELSINDIAALPMFEDEEQAASVMAVLLQHFDAEIQQRRIEPSDVPTWEEVIVLRSGSATTTAA